MTCQNCEKSDDKCECGYCQNCGGIDKLDNFDRNGYCSQCQEWGCEDCGEGLEGCNCD